MEEITLQYFRIYYTAPGDDFPRYADFDRLVDAHNHADLLEHCGYIDIKLDIVDYM